MSIFSKKTVYFSLFAFVFFLVTDALLAQTSRTKTLPNVSDKVNTSTCCKKNGKCVDKVTGALCGTINCPPCDQSQGPLSNNSWGGLTGTGNPCNDPYSTNCKQSRLFNAPIFNGKIPFLVDKSGNTFIERAVIEGNFLPAKANVSSLGSSKAPFKAVYAQKLVGQVSKYSDRRLKINIEASPYGLQTVMALQPSMYHYKNNVSGTKELGLIAQDLQQTVPEVVSQSGDYLSVDYTALVPVLIQAIQEQQQIIDAQKNTIEGQTAAMERTQLELKDLKANMAEVLDYLQLKQMKTSDVND